MAELFKGHHALLEALRAEFGAHDVAYQYFDYDMRLGVSIKSQKKAIHIPARYDDTPRDEIEYMFVWVQERQVWDEDEEDGCSYIHDPHFQDFRITPYNFKPTVCGPEEIKHIVDTFKAEG